MSFIIIIVYWNGHVVLAGCGGWALRCRSSLCGRAESGEHLGPCSEADGDPVHGKLQRLPRGERDLLATEQRRGFWKRGFQTPPGVVSGEARQFLKPIICLPHIY